MGYDGSIDFRHIRVFKSLASKALLLWYLVSWTPLLFLLFTFLQVLFALNQTLLQHESLRAGSLQAPYTTEDLIKHYNCGDLNAVIFNHDTSQVSKSVMDGPANWEQISCFNSNGIYSPLKGRKCSPAKAPDLKFLRWIQWPLFVKMLGICFCQINAHIAPLLQVSYDNKVFNSADE